MPYYHLSLNTDQPVAIKTRISARGISADSLGNGTNSGAATELGDEAATVDELQTVVQLLQIQVQNLGKNLETIIKLYEDQRTKLEEPGVAVGFLRRLGMRLRLVFRRQAPDTKLRF
ncbi:MAG TPA: hypothetical protein VHY08_27090 [Bacillota bacterium]|nr:hypothetical protein [Bacillota bacterium]